MRCDTQVKDLNQEWKSKVIGCSLLQANKDKKVSI